MIPQFWRNARGKIRLDFLLNTGYVGIMKLFGLENERRFEEIKSDHTKRHGAEKCTEGNCHTQWLIARLDDLERRIGNATFLLECHRL